MRLSIEHRTEYCYETPVSHSTQYLRLTPKSSSRQRVLSWDLDMPDGATRSTDGFGNILHVLTMDKPHNAIAIAARGEVEIIDEYLEDDDQRLSPLVYQRFTQITRADPMIRDFALRFAGSAPQQRLAELSAALLQLMPYVPGSTVVSSTATEAFSAGRGVCQDHTHVFLSCCRVLGIPARYVSGYLYTDDSNHVASHAWAEAWLDNRWHTFDVTNQTIEPTHHLKLAVGLDYLDACPVRGVRYGGGLESMQAFALVERSDSQTNQ